MENLLKKYLEKLGLADYSELSPQERATYEEWERILSHEVRIDDVAKFLESHVGRLNKELREAVTNGEDRDALKITARIENYETIIMFIKEPLERRKSLEQQLLSNLE